MSAVDARVRIEPHRTLDGALCDRRRVFVCDTPHMHAYVRGMHMSNAARVSVSGQMHADNCVGTVARTNARCMRRPRAAHTHPLQSFNTRAAGAR